MSNGNPGWAQAGRETPPREFKQAVVREYGRKFAARTLIETGTQFGRMIDAVKDDFQHIISIELNVHLYRRARERFAPYPHITLLPGDSGESPALRFALARAREPVIFWLDAHAMVGGVQGSKPTPIREELALILDHRLFDYVLLIDDVRLFRGSGAYPDLDEVRAWVLARHPDWVFEVRDDIIRAQVDPEGQLTP